MMPRDTDFSRKQESSNSTDNGNASKAGSSSSTTTSWSRFKQDPRIVRVSKAFGGKDRHSKVCTVRGLRDRRVRLSVPTAIQLYDLQERLGLNQPSKVVDWLLDAAKHEIDELPPLQIPQGTFINPILTSHELIPSQSDKQDLKISTRDFNWINDQISRPSSTNFDAKSCKDASGETKDDDHPHQSWSTSEEESRQLSLENQGDHYVSTTNFLSRQNPSSFTSLLSSATVPYNSLLRWDPSNLTLSHPQISLGFTAQNEDLHNFSLVQLPSPVSAQPGSHQLLVYQPGINTHPYFPPQISPANAAFDLKQPNFHSSTSSTDQPVRPFQFSMTTDFLPSQNNGTDEQDELHSS